MKNKKIFIWDFHGVLEKNNDLAIKKIYNQTIKAFGFNKKVSLKEITEIRGLSLFNGFSVLVGIKNKHKLLKMVKMARNLSKTISAKYLKPMDYAKYVLSIIKKSGHCNIVVSNSRQDRIEDFLKIVKLKHLVDCIIGINGQSEINNLSLAKQKAKAIIDYIGKNKFQNKTVIGDSEDDMKAGFMVGAKTYLFIDSNNVSDVKNIKTHYVISDLRNVLMELKS